MRDHGLLGQYAGFFTRAAALILDILIVTGIVFVLFWGVRLPFAFFLNLDLNTCTSNSTLLNTDGITPDWMCAVVDYIWRLLALFAAPIYFILFYSSTGQTVGMYVLGIRVVRLDGKHMTLAGSILRWAGLFISTLPLGLGFLWVLIDDRRQAWHDKLANTCVIYAWRAEQNDFIIGRIERWLSGKRVRRLLGTHGSVPSPRAPGSIKLDLLTIAFSEYERLDNVLDLIQDGIIDGHYHIVNATVLVKGSDQTVGVLAASDLSVGNKVNHMADEPLLLPDYELKHIMAKVPPESFVVAVVLEDRYGDAVVRAVSRETAALVQRFDLDAPAGSGKAPRLASVIK